MKSTLTFDSFYVNGYLIVQGGTRKKHRSHRTYKCGCVSTRKLCVMLDCVLKRSFDLRLDRADSMRERAVSGAIDDLHANGDQHRSYSPSLTNAHGPDDVHEHFDSRGCTDAPDPNDQVKYLCSILLNLLNIRV